MIRLTLPLPRYTKAGKSKLLTMNDYRNIHYRVSAEAKNNYTEVALLNLRPFRGERIDSVAITYDLYFPTNRRQDIGNIGAVVDKFFSDALVKAGIIEDDSHQFVKSVRFNYGGKGPERVEIEVETV